MRYPFTRRSDSASCARPALFEQLEKRELMTAVVNPVAIKVRNVSADGISTNQSVLTIPFTEKVNIADVSKIQLRGFAIDPLNPNLQKKIIINVLDAQVLDVGQDYGLITITTDRLMRMGGQIYFYAGALTHQADGSPVPEQLDARSPKGQNRERFTMACRAFIPQNVDLFSPTIYSAATAPTVADHTVPDAEAEARLTGLLDVKVARGTITDAQRTAALAGYDDDTNRLRVPDHNMRAALFALTGTLAEGAIDTFLGDANTTGLPYTILAFAETSDASVIAETRLTSANRLELRIKPTFSGEHFTAISAILAHESVHQDGTFTIQEEVIANLIQEVVYAQHIDADPSVPTAGTSLVKYLNTQQLALLNSGRALFPVTGMLQGPILHADRGVFPFGKAVPGGNYISYADYLTRQYVARGGVSGTSPGNPTLDSYVEQFATDAPAGAFSDELIARLDVSIYPVMTNALAIRTANILRLGISA